MQIIGTNKCRETKKCRLWFDQRGISYHFVDLNKRPLSEGELDAVARSTGWDALLNRKGKAWKERQLEWKEFDPRTELLETPLLLTTPIVRSGKTVVIGSDTDGWSSIQDLLKER